MLFNGFFNKSEKNCQILLIGVLIGFCSDMAKIGIFKYFILDFNIS